MASSAANSGSRRRCIRGTSVTATLRSCRRPYRRARATLRAGRTAQQTAQQTAQPATVETPVLLICLFQRKPVTVPEGAVRDGPWQASRRRMGEQNRLRPNIPLLPTLASEFEPTHTVLRWSEHWVKRNSFYTCTRLLARFWSHRWPLSKPSSRQRVTAGTCCAACRAHTLVSCRQSNTEIM